MAELEQGPGRAAGDDRPGASRAAAQDWTANESAAAQDPEADLIASTVRTLHARIEEADREALRGTVDPELALPGKAEGEPDPD